MPAASVDDDVARLRADARRIFIAALHAVEPAGRVHSALLNAPELHGTESVHVLAIGKAAVPMASAAIETLGHRLDSALVITPHEFPVSGTLRSSRNVDVIHAGHPLPDEDSLRAGHACRRFLQNIPQSDVIFVLLSGGASALAVLPVDDVDIDTYRNVTTTLMHAGASIEELNIVRGRIDAIKNGGLARLTQQHRVVVLVVSDVTGSRLDIIGSGPFFPTNATAQDAVQIISKYDASGHLHVIADLIAQQTVKHAVSAKPPRHQIVADLDHALDAAAAFAQRTGYAVTRLRVPVTGEAASAGRMLATFADGDSAAWSCIVSGGETTVTVTGGGRGGRSQELALAAAIALEGNRHCVLLSAGTDGVDGPTDAAGAIVDGDSAARMREAGVDPVQSLASNNSYDALRAAGDLLVTGPTGTNVTDVQILLGRVRVRGYDGAETSHIDPEGLPRT